MRADRRGDGRDAARHRGRLGHPGHAQRRDLRHRVDAGPAAGRTPRPAGRHREDREGLRRGERRSTTSRSPPARPAAPTCAPRTRTPRTPACCSRSTPAVTRQRPARWRSPRARPALRPADRLGLARPGIAGAAAGRSFTVTGIVENPSNLLDEFALVAPGQLTAPRGGADLPRRSPWTRPPRRRQATSSRRARSSPTPQPEDSIVSPADDRADRLGARPGLHRPGRLRRVHRHGPAQAARPRHARLARRDRARRPVRADRRRPGRRRARRDHRRGARARRAGSGTTRTWRPPPRTAPTRSACPGRPWSSACCSPWPPPSSPPPGRAARSARSRWWPRSPAGSSRRT